MIPTASGGNSQVEPGVGWLVNPPAAWRLDLETSSLGLLWIWPVF